MSFTNLLRSEIRRALHRPLIRVWVAVALVGCVAAGIIIFLTSRDPVKFATDATHPARMVTWWDGGDDGLVTMGALFLMVGTVICAASFAGAEWKAGTMGTVLVWEPSRLRLHAARTLTAALLTLVIGLAVMLVFLAAALPAVFVNGTTAGVDGAWWASLVVALLRVVLVAAMLAILAVNIATIGRNTAAALVVIAAWAFVIERLIVGLRPQWARFMIIENVTAVVPWRAAKGDGFTRPPGLALASLVVYLAVIVAVATAGFARRDVAAVNT